MIIRFFCKDCGEEVAYVREETRGKVRSVCDRCQKAKLFERNAKRRRAGMKKEKVEIETAREYENAKFNLW